MRQRPFSQELHVEGQVQVSLVRIAGHQLESHPSIAKGLIEPTAHRTRTTNESFKMYETMIP